MWKQLDKGSQRIEIENTCFGGSTSEFTLWLTLSYASLLSRSVKVQRILVLHFEHVAEACYSASLQLL